MYWLGLRLIYWVYIEFTNQIIRWNLSMHISLRKNLRHFPPVRGSSPPLPRQKGKKMAKICHFWQIFEFLPDERIFPLDAPQIFSGARLPLDRLPFCPMHYVTKDTTYATNDKWCFLGSMDELSPVWESIGKAVLLEGKCCISCWYYAINSWIMFPQICNCCIDSSILLNHAMNDSIITGY